MSQCNYFISVVIPTFNRAKSLENSVMSVLRQTYSALECIIVDDSSTDDTEEIVKKMKDGRIRYLKNSKNMGTSNARNIGIKAAQGDFIAFNDSDDIWQENKLELQLKLFENDPNLAMVYCPYYFHKGRRISQVPPSYIPIENKQGDIFKRLLKRNMVGTPTILIRHECVEMIGGFNEQLFASEDYEFVLRIAEKFKIGYVDQCLVNAFRLDEGINSNWNKQINAYRYLLEKYASISKVELLPMILSAYNYIQRSEDKNDLKENMEWIWNFICSIHAKKEFALIQSNQNMMLLYEKEILYKLIEENENSELWDTVIRNKGYKNVAIYGAWKLGVILARHLEENNVAVKAFIDSNDVRIEGFKTVKKENIPAEIDFIIVSLHEDIISINEIQKFTDAKIENIKNLLVF
ncbi:glycosyltransferase family 2 protein [Lacrimispora sp.]|uniref:glycosyltransferase family 2 protein n=1 Tax=Lacrimispora sp. TaxID=2719234 RepID=UPI0028ABD582|nr:glycosyltransferase family 2 protein [Lacrimispora sp.]